MKFILAIIVALFATSVFAKDVMGEVSCEYDGEFCWSKVPTSYNLRAGKCAADGQTVAVPDKNGYEKFWRLRRILTGQSSDPNYCVDTKNIIQMSAHVFVEHTYTSTPEQVVMEECFVQKKRQGYIHRTYMVGDRLFMLYSCR